jgi:hypothetical protein
MAVLGAPRTNDFDGAIGMPNRKRERVYRIAHFNLLEQTGRMLAESRRVIEVRVNVVFEIAVTSTLDGRRDCHELIMTGRLAMGHRPSDRIAPWPERFIA